MTQGANQEFFTKGLLLWNQTHSDSWQIHIDAALWNFKTPTKFCYELVTNSDHLEDGALFLTWGAETKTIWIHFFITPQQNILPNIIALLDLAIKTGKKLGKMKLRFGGDEFHLFPGLPLLSKTVETWKKALLEKGFTGDEVYDLAGSLDGQSIAVDNLPQLKAKFAPKILNTFLQQEYPGRWQREFLYTQDPVYDDGSVWYIVEESNQILGFVRLCLRKNAKRLPGALKLGYAEACLGPIAIAAAYQGQGHGRRLLTAAIQKLQEENVHNLCIDWTNSLDFYKGLNFAIVRKYFCASFIF